MEPEGSFPCSQEPTTGPYPEPYQPTPPTSSVRSILTFSHLYLSLPNSLFLSGIPTNTLHAFPYSRMRAKCLADSIVLQMIALIIFGDECKFFSSYYVGPVGSKYFSHGSVLKHPESAFSLCGKHQVSNTYKTTAQLYLCILYSFRDDALA
jgi:hypothetical protein